MRTAASSLLISSFCLCLAACATGPNTFSKAGVSASQTKSDEAACWHHVLNTPEGREEVETIKIARLIGGGLIGYAAWTVMDQANGSDIDQENNKLAHQDCMKRKGYRGHISLAP